MTTPDNRQHSGDRHSGDRRGRLFLEPFPPTPHVALAGAGGVRTGVPSAHSPDDAEEGLVEGWRRRLGELWHDMQIPEQRTPLLTFMAFVGLLMYAYWPGLLNAKASWSNAQYSHGWIVPLFSVGILLWWRKPLESVTLSARVVGLALLIGAFALRLLAAWFRIVTIDMYTFVPAVGGAFLLACGWNGARWAWSPIAFLIFMFPLPDEATRYLLGPLQTLATTVSTFALQTLGLEAFQEGNQIVIGEMHLGVVDACSGLRMLTIFIALSVALVMLGDRPWWENAIILASAIPIALIVNSIRITVTGMLYQIATSEIAEMVFHDLAGWFMMPMALAMLYGEQFLLSQLMVSEESGVGVVGLDRSVTVRAGGASGPALLPLSETNAARRVGGQPNAVQGHHRREGESVASGDRPAGVIATPRKAVSGHPDGFLPGI